MQAATVRYEHWSGRSRLFGTTASTFARLDQWNEDIRHHSNMLTEWTHAYQHTDWTTTASRLRGVRSTGSHNAFFALHHVHWTVYIWAMCAVPLCTTKRLLPLSLNLLLVFDFSPLNFSSSNILAPLCFLQHPPLLLYPCDHSPCFPFT